MQPLSAAPRDIPVQSTVFPPQADTTSRLLAREHSGTPDDTPLRKASVATAEDASAGAVKPSALTAADTTGSVFSSGGLPLEMGSLILSTIPSGEPSPLSNSFYKTPMDAPPLSSLARPSRRRFSVNSEAQEGEASRSAYRGAHAMASSHPLTVSLIKARPTECSTPYVASRASATMPPESFDPPHPRRTVVCSAGVSGEMESISLPPAESETVQLTAAATLRTPPKLTGTNRHCVSPGGCPACTTTVAAAVTPVEIKGETIFNNGTIWLRDAMQDCAEIGDADARHPYLSPLFSSSVASGASDLDDNGNGASEQDESGTLTHCSPLQRPLVGELSPVTHTTCTTPPPTGVDTAASSYFGGEYTLFQPPAHSPGRCWPCLSPSSVSPLQTNLITDVWTETGGTQDPQSGQQQRQRALSPLKGTSGTITVQQTAVVGYGSLGSPIPLLQRGATTESHDSPTPFPPLWGSTSATTKGPRTEMSTQVFPGTPLIYTPVQLQAPRALMLGETPHTPVAKSPKENLTGSQGVPSHGHSHTQYLTASSPPEKIETPVDKSPQHPHKSPGNSMGPVSLNLYNPYALRGFSAVTPASDSPSPSFFSAAPWAASSSPRTRSAPFSAQDEAAAALSASAAQPEDLNYGNSPTSPHTPSANRTPGPFAFHDNSVTQHSLGHSHSRYRSQLPSQCITPQKSARRTFSRQTTPSQSFRSKVQTNSFEIQKQQHYMAQYGRDVMKGDSQGIAERDYLAPSRNPFSLYRRLDSYVANPSVLPLHATPAAVPPNPTPFEHHLSKKQVMFVEALRNTILRPDAAVVLYEQIVPAPPRPPGIVHRAQMERSVFYSPPTATLENCPFKACLSSARISLAAQCHGGQDVADGYDHRTSLLATQKPAAQPPSREMHIPGQQEPDSISPSGTAATHLEAQENVALSEFFPSTPQSLYRHGLQRASLPVTDATEDKALPVVRGLMPGPSSTALYSQPSAGCSAPRAGRQLQFGDRENDKEKSQSGCDELDCSSSPTPAEKTARLKTVRAWDPIDLHAEGSGSTRGSHKSPNFLNHTASNFGFSSSGRPYQGKGRDALSIPRLHPLGRTPEWETLPPTHDGKVTATAVTVPSLNLTSLAKHTPQLKLRTPTPQQRLSPSREAPGLRIPNESSWIHGGQIPVVAGAGPRVPSADYAETANLHMGIRAAESLSGLLEATNGSDEEIPGDRFQAHHTFQFLHSIVPTSRRGDVWAGAQEHDRRPIPLCVEENGVTWLAVHRLSGLPYAVKEVPSTALNLTELRSITLSMNPSSREATASREAHPELPVERSTTLSADDRLEMEDYIVRYYSLTTPPQSSDKPKVHLLQLEYFPRGSLWDLATRCNRPHGVCSAHAPTPPIASAGEVKSRFWLEAVSQGLRGLRVLHHAHLIHGYPLPLSLFLCGNTSSTVRFKWACFGNARAHSDPYPMDSVPAWMREAMTQPCQTPSPGDPSAAPEGIEVALFCLGILDILVNYGHVQLFDVPQSHDWVCLSKLKRIEAVVGHTKKHPHVGGTDCDEDTRTLMRLIHILWDVSASCSTADQALARLGVCIDPAAQAVEQLYECELDRLTHQLEERRHRSQHQGQMEALHSGNKGSCILKEASFLYSSEARAAVASTFSRRHVEALESFSPPLNPAPDPFLVSTSASPFGAVPLPPKSRSNTPNVSYSVRTPLHPTLLERPLTMPKIQLLPRSASAEPPADASVALGPPRLELAASDWTRQGCSGGMLGHRRKPDIHPVMLEAANCILENALSYSGGSVMNAMTTILRPVVESMYQRGWTSLCGGVPITVPVDSTMNERTESSDGVETIMKSLRPLTSFE
ncbi:hypothetical protein JKF63_03801 [Porcisia hertigi]|uniref:Protein kinase domain-containing protein n=1 Tax=Porcisia hertigi TaxID=2761500 RepID=A0A836I3I2_9TRYP|nr:hypothetical protein JKF63_03801 [Porcisia hertigi]